MIKEFKTQNIPVSSNIFKMKAPEFAKLLGFDEVPASDRLNALAGRINVSLSASGKYTYIRLYESFLSQKQILKLNLHYISISLMDRYKL